MTHKGEPMGKVLAYITRPSFPNFQLLVFTHRDYPEAGVQVPAGTIQKGEAPEIAVMREAEEETGLQSLVLLGNLGTFLYDNPYTGQLNERHVFHLGVQGHTANNWEWIETDGGAKSESEGYVFLFYWVSLGAPISLAGGQGDYIGELLEVLPA